MELEVFPQRISVTQDVFPGCRVASSFWAKVLAAPVSNNSVALAALLGDSGLPAALAPVARGLAPVLRWYMERWDALIQPWLGKLACNSTSSTAVVRRAMQAVTSPEADRALGATLALLQPAVKDFLTSTSTGAVLTDFMLSTYGFDTSLLTGASTSGGLLSAVQMLKQKTNVTSGDSFAAYSTAASAALAWLGDELVAVNPRISARQVAVDLVRLADKLLRTALAGPTPELLATGAAAAPGHRRRRVLQAGSVLTALAGYTNVSISAVFAMSATQRQAFVDVTNSLPALSAALQNVFTAIEKYPGAYTAAVPAAVVAIPVQQSTAGIPAFSSLFPQGPHYPPSQCHGTVGGLAHRPLSTRGDIECALNSLPLVADLLEVLPPIARHWAAQWDAVMQPLLGQAICGSLAGLQAAAGADGTKYSVAATLWKRVLWPGIGSFLGTPTGSWLLAKLGFASAGDLDARINKASLQMWLEGLAQRDPTALGSELDNTPEAIASGVAGLTIRAKYEPDITTHVRVCPE
ncbi:hypothetical protein HXX76_002313 [Chlamydomonas incerta]|uniref:Uncharacterized protein n=1 Tax=Chlamydomonas incerta TaxID=51695 RepID=A0A835VRV1_CHLIN|nr:hypothetical protein HXX76_002313 [Chlamydomonas incerta]|eukprot:KAG2423086.1 hypothetical protein HXX76_002313 [Chlamydomonas incerta]